MGRGVAAAAAAVLTAAGLVSVCAAGAGASTAAPRIVSVVVAPHALARSGGTLQVKVRVRAARTCSVESQRFASGPFAPVGTVQCSSGSASVRVHVQRNPYEAPAAIHVRVTARSADGRRAVKTVAVREAPQPAPPEPVDPLSLESDDTLPSGSVGAPYASSLSASGGTKPYHWTIGSGALPAGLMLTPDGTITGTPTVPGDSTFGVRIADASARSTTVPLSITVAPATVGPTGTAADGFSSNWSGYVLEGGGPYTSITGTFTVPSVISGGTSDSAASEWVGIDGTSSANPGIIQAGVVEIYSSSTAQYGVFAWIELYPAPSFEVPLDVAPGNVVNVSIVKTSAPGIWNITMKNLTSGQTYAVSEPWTGPESSAEWIVEAPTSGQTLQIYPFPTISPVTFSQLGANPIGGGLSRLMMVQGGATVSTPSPLDPNGFTVAYGSVTPAAP